jgi:hypothetical protein
MRCEPPPPAITPVYASTPDTHAPIPFWQFLERENTTRTAGLLAAEHRGRLVDIYA